MTVVYYENEAPETLEKSIFLAGPSPRLPHVRSWRPEALQILEQLGYDGVVFVPECGGPMTLHPDPVYMIAWEDRYLHMADQVVFWVPRDMQDLPGLTTNIEFGRWEDSGRTVLGHPVGAPHTYYMDLYARKEGVPVCDTLKATLEIAVKRIRAGAPRTGGEREVPLHVWYTPEFSAWHEAQKGAGNRLDGAKVVWSFRVGKNKERCFMWAIHVKVWIASENRHKTNEVILQRPDIFAVVAWRGGANILDSEILIVREFRSPAATPDGKIHELPGGSVKDEGDRSPGANAVEELEEETGLVIPTRRLKSIGTRQIYGTLMTHKAHVFAVKLDEKEMLHLKWMKDTPHGIEEDTERTYVEVRTLGDLLRSRDVDWANLGMVLATLADDYWRA